MEVCRGNLDEELWNVNNACHGVILATKEQARLHCAMRCRRRPRHLLEE